MFKKSYIWSMSSKNPNFEKFKFCYLSLNSSFGPTVRRELQTVFFCMTRTWDGFFYTTRTLDEKFVTTVQLDSVQKADCTKNPSKWLFIKKFTVQYDSVKKILVKKAGRQGSEKSISILDRYFDIKYRYQLVIEEIIFKTDTDIDN